MDASPTDVHRKSVDPSHQDDAAMTENAEPVSVVMQGMLTDRRAAAVQWIRRFNAQKKDKSVSTIPVTTAILKPEGLTVSVCVFRVGGIAPRFGMPRRTLVSRHARFVRQRMYSFKAKEDCVADSTAVGAERCPLT